MRLCACSAVGLSSSKPLLSIAAGLYIAIERGLDPHKLLSQYGLLSGERFASALCCLPPDLALAHCMELLRHASAVAIMFGGSCVILVLHNQNSKMVHCIPTQCAGAAGAWAPSSAVPSAAALPDSCQRRSCTLQID